MSTQAFYIEGHAILYLIAFQKANEFDNYFLSWSLLSLEFTCRHYIIEVCYFQKNDRPRPICNKTSFTVF